MVSINRGLKVKLSLFAACLGVLGGSTTLTRDVEAAPRWLMGRAGHPEVYGDGADCWEFSHHRVYNACGGTALTWITPLPLSDANEKYVPIKWSAQGDNQYHDVCAQGFSYYYNGTSFASATASQCGNVPAEVSLWVPANGVALHRALLHRENTSGAPYLTAIRYDG